jgi:drug/metabolite transporter (DMT)-like permease
MGAVFAVPVSLAANWPFQLEPSIAAATSWLALTLLGTVVAYRIYYALIERTSATFVSTVTYVIPVYGLALGAVVLGEPINALLLGSLALILVGVLLVRS